jgi:hypothetical protein
VWARFLIIFLTHPNVLRHLLCLQLHLHPLDQNLLLARDEIINPPVVGVKRRRDGGGQGVSITPIELKNK